MTGRFRHLAATATSVAAVLLRLGTAAAQTVPDLPQEAQGPVRAVNQLVQPTFDELAATPAAAASQLLAAAPVVGPLYATYARGDFEPPVATDLNPEPDVVEVVIVAIPALWEFRPGVPTLVWTFNGTIPGPTIEAKLGDEVVVHFVNLIDTPGGVHWHGVEVPAKMDGSHVSAPATMRGETFEYRFRVNRPALFWYHPHHDATQQIERGLYGALLVHDPADADRGLPANERLLVLDDVLLNGAGQFETFYPSNPSRAPRIRRTGARTARS